MTRDEMFWAKVNKTETCWLWTAAKLRNGYGQFGVGYPRVMLAHRWAWENAHGPIPAGMQVDHICRVRLCVNPAHLRVVTNKQNHENIVAQSNNRSSGVRGVYWDKRVDRWYVQVTHYGKRHYGGNYAVLDDAERAAVELRNQLHTHNTTDRGVA